MVENFAVLEEMLIMFLEKTKQNKQKTKNKTGFHICIAKNGGKFCNVG